MGEYDVVVIGGGPAGMTAGVAASEAGGRVLLIDRGVAGGGQVYRPAGVADRPDTGEVAAETAVGDDLRRRLESSAVERSFRSTVWSVTDERVVHFAEPAGPRTATARALVVATGAQERIVPFDGWLLPGVIGLGAATNMMKVDRAVPTGRTVVAGVGPLLYAVAMKILDLGGDVAAIADLSTTGEWARRLPGMLPRGDLVLRGLRWIAGIRRRGVPIHRRHAVIAAEGDDALSLVRLAPTETVRRGSRSAGIEIEADCLCVGHGLQPNTEITRLIGARHRYEPGRGGWVPVRDPDGETTVQGVFVAGDAAGIAGAAASELEGARVGLAAAAAAGLTVNAPLRAKHASGQRRLQRAMRFGRAMAEIMRPRPELLGAIGPDTPICRCEEVTRSEVETLGQGASDINMVKRLTRCGMGPCQGRYCAETVGLLLSAIAGKTPSELGYWTPRPPLFPVEIGMIVGDYGYDDIPMPTPLPG